mmetsp:Transcript_26128/g.75334  ORF Transcript_26128/g.75334 Transcript_26128/m.75334 type:complete len:242 (+) Transcript_26128:611-1336(+)
MGLLFDRRDRRRQVLLQVLRTGAHLLLQGAETRLGHGSDLANRSRQALLRSRSESLGVLHHLAIGDVVPELAGLLDHLAEAPRHPLPRSTKAVLHLVERECLLQRLLHATGVPGRGGRGALLGRGLRVGRGSAVGSGGGGGRLNDRHVGVVAQAKLLDHLRRLGGRACRRRRCRRRGCGLRGVPPTAARERRGSCRGCWRDRCNGRRRAFGDQCLGLVVLQHLGHDQAHEGACVKEVAAPK